MLFVGSTLPWAMGFDIRAQGTQNCVKHRWATAQTLWVKVLSRRKRGHLVILQ